nr:hypothetical protein CFP56_22091 [Quercus suber]
MVDAHHSKVQAFSALVPRHFINGGDSSSSGDPKSNDSTYSFSFGPDFHVPFRGRFIKLTSVPSYSPNGLIPLTFRSQKRCELRQGTEYRKSLKFTMPSRRD